MFKNIRSLLGIRPQRSESDEKLDEALANAKSLDHYFFFPDQGDAAQATIGLQERGWTIESVSLHLNQQKWLVQARQLGPVDNLNELQTELDLFADDHHGEYDGWQVPGVTEHL
jgi:Regulator of ribonuclease activity B